MNCLLYSQFTVTRYIGIDFSGDVEKWRPNRSRSNVWIALARRNAVAFEVERLFRVQDCAKRQETKSPFSSLIKFLRGADFVAAGIDAPFSVPSGYVPAGGHRELLDKTVAIDCDERPFPRGADFIASLSPISGADPLPWHGRKVYRETEGYWANRGINVRSTLWNGPRGGAPFTAACLPLLAHTGPPIWPWAIPHPETRSLLVEAFPAGQLFAWGLPCNSYNGSGDHAREVRQTIITGIEARTGLVSSADVVWRRSVCRFGHCLCHSVAPYLRGG